MSRVRSLLGRLLERQYVNHGRFKWAYLRLADPDGLRWASVLKQRGVIYEMGEDCYIQPDAILTDPVYLRIGNNVRISTCTILGHDGSVNMINRAYGLKLDNVGPVTILDNVFISWGAIILPGVTIGPNAIVGAGSVVSRDVREGDIVAGVPARPVGRLDLSVEMLKAKNARFPWRQLIESRDGEWDPALEPELIRLRQAHFFDAPARCSADTESA
jgi:acetyltransferase-like isoleucine patch superfamily enzyme